ncbi:hypothetical protein [Acinetobacter variabilis]|uniref:hypothetical protein n=1 Tax=Acinetobacter variabilis TaxID=70346 RepID=UPI0035D43C72
MVEIQFQQKVRELIDGLKAICANYGLGNDGNEFKIITQAFLYKFLGGVSKSMLTLNEAIIDVKKG